jgi:NAD(P)-dependent dehydrogenase (short-subunit alcohol dehydrogenase family)
LIILAGSSGGLGQALIKILCEDNNVIGTYNNAKESSLYGYESEFVSYQKLDLTDENDILEFVDNNKEKLQNITLVLMAGVCHDELLVNHGIKSWKNVIDTNLTSNFILIKTILPLMIKQKWGRIIHISSIRSELGTSSYSASKSGLSGLSSVVAKEYARFNVTSNILTLGAFNAGLFEDLSDKLQQEMRNQIPSKKLGEVKDIYHAVNFLIKSQFVNGAIITIDGGVTA